MSIEERRAGKAPRRGSGKGGGLKGGGGGGVDDVDLKLPVRRKEGKRRIYEAGLICNGVATALLFAAYVSPYWIESWRRVFSPFKRIGLWEACFAGMILYADPTQKAYHGCWWILAPEYTPIRGWLMPGWFIFTQVATTLVILAEIVGFGIIFILWLGTGGRRKADQKPAPRGQQQQAQKKESIIALQTGVGMTVFSALLMGVTCIIFGVGHYLERRWLPNPEFNYLSWSYGLTVLSSFFQIFAMICQVTYVMIVRQEMREPPRDLGFRGYASPVHANPVYHGEPRRQAPVPPSSAKRVPMVPVGAPAGRQAPMAPPGGRQVPMVPNVDTRGGYGQPYRTNMKDSFI